jgi:hypothetical protein
MAESSAAPAIASTVPAAPVTSQPAASPAPAPSGASPAARAGVISDAQFDNLPADQRDRYARMRKGPDGGSEWVARDELEKDPAATTAPGEKHKIGAYEVSESELAEMMTRQAADDLRKATLPATPADYVPALPENFKLPPGVDFTVDVADPMLADARAWAHSKGLSQSDFSELISIYATGKGHEQALLNTATAAEVAKMGANGTQRVTALETWLRGIVGDKLAGPMRQMMVTADIAKGFETLQQRFVSQGVASFSQAHREPVQAGGKVSDEEYSKMSHAARLDYARGFDQRQFGGVNPNGYSSDQR